MIGVKSYDNPKLLNAAKEIISFRLTRFQTELTEIRRNWYWWMKNCSIAPCKRSR